MVNIIYDDEPMYVISVAARLVEMHPQTLRYYERMGLMKPTRSGGRIRLYSQRDVERLRKIARLTNELGVNLAGVEIIMELTEKLARLQAQVRELTGQDAEIGEEIIDAHHYQHVEEAPSQTSSIPSTRRMTLRTPPTSRRKR